jgi:glycosyltransferase involved in cell wall biosynthesis
MKILVAHNRYRSLMPSGENAVVDEEIQLLNQTGFEVVPFIASSDDIPQLSSREKLGVAVGSIYNPYGVRRFREMLRDHGPDLVHVHNVFPLLSPWIVREARRAGLPVIMTVHNFRLDCVAGTYFRDGRVCTDCSGFSVAMPAILHGCYRSSRTQTVPMVVSRSLHKKTWMGIDTFFALTQFHADYLVGLGVPSTKIIIRPTSAADPGQPSRIGRDALFIGRLSDEKGINLLLEAWPTGGVSDRQLLVVGSGPLASAVQARAAADQSVRYLGKVGPQAVQTELRKSAVVLVPSTCYEGFPRVVSEAFASGRPVMATNHGGLASAVREDRGWLLPPIARMWMDALEALTDRDLQERGEAARQYYVETLSPTMYMETTRRAYEAALSRRRRQSPTSTSD